LVNFDEWSAARMGGYGSGQRSSRPIVEQALRLDIDRMKRCGAIQVGSHVVGQMRLALYDDDIDVKFESRARDPWDGWVRLRYSVSDFWTGEDVEIDDRIRLTTTQPSFGGLRWWFKCPSTNRRCRHLLLPLVGTTSCHAARMASDTPASESASTIARSGGSPSYFGASVAFWQTTSAPAGRLE
jgi:hypothetical protein